MLDKVKVSILEVGEKGMDTEGGGWQCVRRRTWKLLYKKYPWSRMCPSQHKLLKHGCDGYWRSALDKEVESFINQAIDDWL